MSVDVERGRGQTLIQSTLLGEAAELAPIGVFVTDETLAFIAVRGADELEADYRTLIEEGALEVEGPARLADGTIRTIRYRAYKSSVAGMDVLFGFASFIDDAPIVVQ